MKRLRFRLCIGAFLLAVAGALLALVPSAGVGAATAQVDACSPNGDYPPDDAEVEPEAIQLVDAQFTPGGTGRLVLNGATPGKTYDGVVYSDPIQLPPTAASGDGSLVFSGFAVPADFELGATHTIQLCGGDDVAVLSAAFCVGSDGALVSTSGCTAVGGDDDDAASGDGDDTDSSGLPFTGSGEVEALAKLGLLLITAGVALRFGYRRRSLNET